MNFLCGSIKIFIEVFDEKFFMETSLYKGDLNVYIDFFEW